MPSQAVPLDYASHRRCPRCGGGPLVQPSFTWWGGAIGHRVLGLERCDACWQWLVKKTGQPGGTRIAVYFAISLILGLAVGVFFVVTR
jgi:hypothetical protein